jgi:aromatic ring-cleaving dioxygenase
MKVGDLVKYRGWGTEPLALVVEQKNSDSDYHHRVRIMWVGEQLPIQAKVLSTTNSRISTWISPKHFEIVNEVG